ncbi:HdeD family acid-resistance protein [Brachybacterium sp. MASK1Z-5]|uniref:HdeD family acid-resistance protein n=1 Tax=Brachybacterium halotolerans TaxID=2795215 RepID=A0ABS1B820_9MICO|nr:HdeD family acid-resistance protein [Brachybacterium halotolerans]MBK0330784.1 HdeD family acid-resistance protein [Brachybacterium halotolerans]
MSASQPDAPDQTESTVPAETGWSRLRKGARIALIVQGALSVLVALVLLFDPLRSMLVLTLVVGAWLLVTGIAAIISHIARDAHHRSVWTVVSGALSIVAGALVMIMPGSAAVAAVAILATWAILLGITYGLNSLALRRAGAPGWWGVLITGILAVLLGILMLANPGAAMLGLVWAIGIYALVDGISELILGIRLGSPRSDRP